MVLAGAEVLDTVVVVALHEGSVVAGKDGGEMLELEVLLERKNELDDELHLRPSVEHLLGVQTVVADTAVILGIVLAEVSEKQPSAAVTRLCIGDHFIEQLFADFLLGDGLAAHEFLELLDILITIVGDADTFPAVAAGTACLLIVALHALGDVVVDDKTDIRLVDAHAEGYGGDYHVDVLHQELVLVLRADLGIEPGVVRQGLDSVDLEELGHLLNLAAAQTVDNAGLAGMLADETDYVLVGIDLVADFVVEVGAVERRLVDHGLGNTEGLQDIALDFGGCSCREGDYRCTADRVHDGTDAAVLRTEVVAPFGDTVRFVHGIEGDLDSP